MKARIPIRDRSVARTFAVLTYVFSLLLAFLAGGVLHTHAVGYLPYLFALGVGFAVLSPFIWFGARWAMILASLIGVPLWLVTGSFFFVVPAILGVLTLMHALARPTGSRPTSQAAADINKVLNKVQAGLVYAYSFAIALIAPIYHTNQLGAPIISSYALLLGLALGVMSTFIWRGASWAMIVVCALVTTQWLVLGSLDPVFWANSTYSAPVVVFVLLTVASMVVAKVRAT